jgi:hypothetical protein
MLVITWRMLPVLNRLDHDDEPREEDGDGAAAASRGLGEGVVRYQPVVEGDIRLLAVRPARIKKSEFGTI